MSVVCLRASLKGFRLVAQGDLPLEKDAPLGERVSVAGQFLPEFLKRNRIAPTMIFLGIPRRYTVLRYVQLPLAVKENLRAALGYEMEKYVPFPPEEIYFDFQIIREDRDAGMMRLLLVAVKKEDLSLFLPVAEEIKVGISGIEVRATAMANYFAARMNANGGKDSAFLHVGERCLDIGFLEDGRLDYTKEVPLPSDDADFAHVMVKELEGVNRRRIEGSDPLNAVLCVPEEKMPRETLKGDRGLDIQYTDLSQTGLASCRAVPAFGLAMKGFQNPSTDINLLPPRLRKRASRIGLFVMFSLGALLILSLATWGGARVLKYRFAVDRLNAELRTLSTAMAEIDRDRAGCNRLEKRIEALNAMGKGPSVLEVLRELSERIPDSAWVIGFTFSEKGVELEGEADSASELIPLLDASPIFGDVVFRSTITKTREGKDRFRIGLTYIVK